MPRVSALLVALSLACLPPLLAVGQLPPEVDENALVTLNDELRGDPTALEQALRGRLVAAQDDAARVTWTTGLVRLLLRADGRADAAIEALLAAEAWASAETMDYIIREAYGPWLGAERTKKVLQATAKALEQHPASRVLWVSAGRVKGLGGDDDGALEAWTRAQAIASTPYGLRGLSRTYRQLGKWEDAVATARTIPDLTVTEQSQYVAEPLQKLGRADEIVSLADELAARTDLTCLDLRSLSATYFMANRFDRTEECLLKAVDLAGENIGEAAKARYSLGSLFEAKGDPLATREQYLLSAEAGLDNAQHWVARHLVDWLSDPAAVDRMLKAGVIPGVAGGVYGVSPSWFDDLPGLPDEVRTVVNAAETAQKLPDLIAAVGDGLGRNPGSLPHLAVLVAARYRSNDLAGAAEAARLLNEADPDEWSAHRVGVLYQRAGDHARAAEYFAQAQPPIEPQAFRWMGLCYAALGQTDRIEEIAAALRAEGGDEYQAHAEGLLRFGAGQWEQAIPLLQKAPLRAPYGPRRELAQAYANSGQTQAAIEAYRDCLRGGSGRTWTDDMTALVGLLRDGKAPGGYLPDVAGVLREHRPSGEGLLAGFWRDLVTSEEAAGRLSALIEALKAETTAHADDGAVWAVLGLAQTKASDYEAAVASFDTGAQHGARWWFPEESKLASDKKRENSPAARAQEAWQDYQRNFRPALQGGDWDRAAEIACNLLAGFSGGQIDQRDQMLLSLAMNAKAAKPYDAFIAAVGIRAEQSPDDPVPTLFLAHCYYQNKQHDKAVETLTEAEKLFEKDCGAWVLLGRAQQKLGHGADAAEAWRKALDLATTDEARSSIQKLLDEAKAQGF
ncbi:MAG: hypothetical protein FJX75_09075 [Armatimonadetes bacterium]|nr:hypothetical protein [Armatimonadota bacterium]